MDRREQFKDNENRAKHSASINPPTPCSSEYRPPSPGDMPNGILNENSVPRTLDPHKHGAGHTDNAIVQPPEKPRSHYTAETRRRETSVVDKYK